MAHPTESVSLQDKNYFLVRRLHSLLGLVPVGAFLCVHLLTNATILAPGEAGGEFQKSVERIHALGPLLVPVEVVFIFLPLLFHSLLGFQIVFNSQSNAQQYRYGSNLRYTAQRTTGILAFLFIFYHIWQMHWFGKPVGGGAFELHDAAGAATGAMTTAVAIQQAWWIAPVYAIGVLSCVFHLANGLWTSLITWGITIRPESQRIASYVCAVIGLVLAIAGMGALSGFRTFDVKSPLPVVTDGHADATSHGH